MREFTSTVPILVKFEIPIQRFNDLLVGAFEGGSNYWYRIESRHAPKSATSRPEFVSDYPCLPDHHLTISDFHGVEGDEDQMHIGRLDFRALIEGAQVMAVKYPRHWDNFIRENDDAETADVFLQCCMFGEIVYG